MKIILTVLVLSLPCLSVLADSRIRKETEIGAAVVKAASNEGAVWLTPKFGGTIAFTRSYAVEVILRPYGKVKAIVSDLTGTPVSPLGMRVNVRVPDGRGMRALELLWDPTKREFAAFLPHGVQPHKGVIQVVVAKRGTSERGEAFVPVLPKPRHGGVVIAAGGHAYEVLLRQVGRIDAIPFEPMNDEAALQREVTLAVHGRDKEPYAIPLRWDLSMRRYVGRTPSGVIIGAGPLDMVVRVDRNVYRGSFTATAPLSAPRVGGVMVAAGPYTVEVTRFFQDGSDVVEALVLDRVSTVASYKHTQLTLEVRTQDGHVYPIPMSWRLQTGRYAGFITTPPNNVKTINVRIMDSTMVNSPFNPEVSWAGSIDLDTKWNRSTRQYDPVAAYLADLPEIKPESNPEPHRQWIYNVEKPRWTPIEMGANTKANTSSVGEFGAGRGSMSGGGLSAAIY